MQLLNVYVDQLASKRALRPSRLEFFVHDSEGLENPRKITAQLSSNGSLSPLFHAFGLIDAQELEKTGTTSSQDIQLLRWLSLTVQEAVTTAERHEQLKLRIRKLRGDVEKAFCLSSVQAGAEYSASIQDQERQMESLTVLDQTLKSLTAGSDGPSLDLHCIEGCHFRLYHPNDPDTVKESMQQMHDNGNVTFKTFYGEEDTPFTNK